MSRPVDLISSAGSLASGSVGSVASRLAGRRLLSSVVLWLAVGTPLLGQTAGPQWIPLQVVELPAPPSSASSARTAAPALSQSLTAPRAGRTPPSASHAPMRYSGMKLPSLLVSSDDDLLAEPSGGSGLDELEAMSKQPQAPAADALPGAGHGQDRPTRDGVSPGADPHADAFAETLYPSALKCAKCHQKIYDEWRVSSHAYAAVSPMFQRFEQAMTNITKGTVGYFCIRCHAPVATQMEYPREASIVDGPAVFREGITCVACHRVVERYGRVNGERRIEPGDIFQPVVGNLGGQGIAQVIADADNFKVKLDSQDKRPGLEMHRGAIKFEQLSESAFCVSCHQVVVHPGVALPEPAASPAKIATWASSRARRSVMNVLPPP
jgi:hypothetical protein